MNRPRTILLFAWLCFGCNGTAETSSPRPHPPAPKSVAASSPAPSDNSEEIKKSAPIIRENGTAGTDDSVTLPRLLVFSRDNCLPCEIMAPWVESIAQKYEGHLETLKLNLDRPDVRPLGRSHQITTVPTQVYLNAEGDEVFRHRGLATLNEMNAAVDRYLPASVPPQ